MISQTIDIVLHIDKYLLAVVDEYSILALLLLFLVIFIETGVVVMPFLPGDSLLFASGAIAGVGSLNVLVLFVLVFVAAVLGDTLNYHIGKYVGPKIFNRESSLLFNKEYLVKAQSFYEKHGKKTIILARFIPIIRTFAPFVAGVGVMRYRVFLAYNMIGGLFWCALFVFGGFLFGNIVWVKDNFGIIVIGIVVVSLLPLVHGLLGRRGS